MRVCCVAYTNYETDYRVRRYAETLAAEGHEVDVVALRSPDLPRDGALNGVRVTRIHSRRFNEKRPLDFLTGIMALFIKGSVLILWRHLRKPYKLLHIHNVPDFLVFMALPERLLGARVVLDIHDILPEFYAQKFGVSPQSPVIRMLRVVEFCSVRFASHVIVANDLWRQKIMQRCGVAPDRCSALLNYPKVKFFSGLDYSIRPNRLNLIYPGHLSHHHGVDIAVRAMAGVRDAVPQARLYIHPSSWEATFRTSLEALIDELALRETVVLRPAVRVDELASIYRDIDIGVVPKRGGVFASEAFSTKALDFMAAGIPIVASRTTIDEYYFDDSQIAFFTPENHGEMADRILQLYNDPERRRSLSEAGKAFVALNNWDSMQQEYVSLAQSLTTRDRLWRSA
ncbi:MAG: glycosyltransferase [Chitinivibrionales bacterium]|nr:glycosyltransferase [Chitinivibrionales bacterium]